MTKPWEETYAQPETKKPWELSYASQEPEELPTRSVGAFAKDVGTSLAKGVIGAEQGLVGLADIPTGGRFGKYLEEQGFDFEKNQKLLEEQYSPQQKAENKALAEAHGVMGTIGAALSNPTAVGAMLGESVPSIFAGGILGKVAKIAKGVSVAGAAGIGEGLIGAGSAEENIRNQSEDGLVSGKGTLAAIGTGIGTGVLGALGSKLTTAMGGIDVDTLLVGGARRALAAEVGVEAATSPNVFKRVVISALGEGVFEEAPQSAQEQMWQNYATDKPLMEGVPESATKGALLGSFMGGVVGGFSNTQTPPATTATGEGERKEEQGYKEELTPQAAAVVKKNDLKAVGLGPEHPQHAEMMKQDFSTPEGIAAAEAFVQGNSEKLGGINDDAWNKLIAKSKERVGVVEQASVVEEVKAPVEEVKAPVEEVKAPVVDQARDRELKSAEVSNQLFNAVVNLQEGYHQAQEEDAMYGQSKTMPRVKKQFNKMFSGLLSAKEKKALYEHWFEEGNLGSGDFTNNEYFDLAHTNLMNRVNPPVKAPVVEEEVKAPVVEEVKAPIVEPITTPAAKAPRVKKVKAEVAPVEEVKAPVVKEVKAPVVKEVKAPVVKEVKAPVEEEEVKAPVEEEVKAPVVKEVKSSEPIQIDEAKVTAYDSALERASVLAEGGSKGAARPFMKSLVAQGLISAAQLKKYGNDAPLTELMQAVNTDLQTGRETTLTTPVTPTKIIPHTEFGVKTTKATPIKEKDLTGVERRQQAADVLRANVEAKKAEIERLAEEKRAVAREIRRLNREQAQNKPTITGKAAPTVADLNAKVTAARKLDAAITAELKGVRESHPEDIISEQGEQDVRVHELLAEKEAQTLLKKTKDLAKAQAKENAARKKEEKAAAKVEADRIAAEHAAAEQVAKEKREIAAKKRAEAKAKKAAAVKEVKVKKEIVKPKVENPPQWAQNAAKMKGGTVVYVKGNTALVKGSSVVSGAPVFMGATDTSINSLDIERYTGELFSVEEKAELVKAKKEWLSADNALHEANPNGPFKLGETTAFSDQVPDSIRGVINEWKKMLGISERIYVTTLADAATSDFHGPFATIASHQRLGLEQGSARKLANGDYVIAYTPNKLSYTLEILSHEMGHVLEKTMYESASPEVKAAIDADYKTWLASTKGKTAREHINSLRARSTAKATKVSEGMSSAELSSYWSSKSEWFADQVARWATTADKPLSVVEKFFQRLGQALKRFFLQNRDFLPTQTMHNWLNSLEGTVFSKEKLLAPNGKPSNLNPMQHAQVRTPEFKEWFGDWENDPENASKVVDENGEPKIVYHGTGADISIFDPTKTRIVDGVFFAPDPEHASSYAESFGNLGGKAPNVISAYINVRTPTIIKGVDFDFDSINSAYSDHTNDGAAIIEDDGESHSFIVWEPNQIKSAIGNTGAFSAENDDIRYSLSSTEQASVAAGEARVGTPAVKPPKTPFYKNIDSVISNQETKYLSYDAKFINTLRNSIKKLGLPVQAMQKLMLRASQSQTVQATTTAGAAATQGDIKYNPNSFNWEAVAGKHSAPRLRQFIEDMAVAKGETYDTVNKIFGDIMVAARIDEIYKKATKIKAKIRADKAAIRGMQAHIDTLTNKQDIIDASEILKTAENTLRRYRLNNIKKLRIAVNEQQHMSKKEVAQHLQTLAANPEYRAPLEEWQGIRKSVIEFLVASGRYSQEQADAYMDAVSYVPFQRIMHDMDVDSDTAYVRASERTVGKAGLSAGQRERAMRGSAREVDDIVSNIEKWVVNSYIKGIKAAKSKELIDLADSYLPPGAVTELKGPELGAVTCYREGVKEYWRFDDPFMTFAFNGINNPLVIPTLKTGARVANKLREFIVLNPLFTISQLPQDTFAAMLSSGVKHPFALPYEVIKEFGATLFNTQRAKTGAHAKLAAIGATGQKDFVDSFASSIHDIAYGGDIKKKSKLTKHLEHIAMAGDNAVRQAVYNRTLKEMKGHPLAEAIAQERAFEIINFRRKGASATLDGLRQITPFFGAYLQAQRVALNVLSGRGIAPTERKEAMQTLAITTAKVAAFTVLYNMALGAAGIGGDDEGESDFTKRNIKDRDKKMFVPWTKATLPLRQDVFSIPFIVANHAYQYMFEKGTKNPAEAWKAVGMAVLHTLPGVGMPMGPTIAKPILEVAINHDFFTGRDITPMRLQGKDTSLQYNEQTSEIAKMLGKTGYINPMYVDHIVKGLTGYVGGAALAVSDMAIRAGLDTPYMEKGILGKGARDIPGMTSLLAKDYDPKDVDTYYTMRTEVDKVNDTYNTLKKLGKREEAREYKADNRLALKEGVHQQLNKMVSKVDAINEKIRKLAETPNEVMSPEVKRARRDQLDAKIRHIESGINRLYPRVHPE